MKSYIQMKMRLPIVRVRLMQPQTGIYRSFDEERKMGIDLCKLWAGS